MLVALRITDRVRLRGIRPVAKAAERLRTRPERYLEIPVIHYRVGLKRRGPGTEKHEESLGPIVWPLGYAKSVEIVRHRRVG